MLSDRGMESFDNTERTMLTENDSLVPDENAPLENDDQEFRATKLQQILSMQKMVVSKPQKSSFKRQSLLTKT